MLSDLKNWQDREEYRVEKIRGALEKSEKKRSQAEKDLLDTYKLLEEKHKEVEDVKKENARLLKRLEAVVKEQKVELKAEDNTATAMRTLAALAISAVVVLIPAVLAVY